MPLLRERTLMLVTVRSVFIGAISACPLSGTSALGLGFDVVLQYIHLAVAERPGVAAGYGAGLASDTLVDVECNGELLIRAVCLVWILHLSAHVSVENFRHPASHCLESAQKRDYIETRRQSQRSEDCMERGLSPQCARCLRRDCPG